MRSLFAGVSGLKAHQTRMDVVGNNISNINTIGFKSSRVTFSDMLSQTTSNASAPTTSSGGTNAKQIGLGSAVASVDMMFTDGSAQSTGKNTDLTLSGNGLFVLQKGGDTFYSRDGAFEFDTDGNFVLPGSGYYVQGWNGTDGTINTTAAVENINVKVGQTMAGTATSNVDYSGNLNSAAPTITGIAYTSGGGTADPTKVISNKTIDNITVMNAYNMTYDDRVMTDAQATLRYNTTDSDGNTVESTTTVYLSDSATNPIAASFFSNGEVRATTGTNAKFVYDSGTEDTADDIEYSVDNLRYTLDRTITTRADDTAVALTLSNGRTVSVSGTDFTPGTAYTIGTSFSDTDAYDSTTMLSFSDATISSIVVTDVDSNTTSYPATVSSNAGTSLKLGYTDDSKESVTTGSYSTGGEIFNSVNVDGVNVIAATLTLSDGTTQKVTSGFYERNHSIPVSTVVTVYDSIGNSHAVSVLIDKDNASTDAEMNTDALALARVTDDSGSLINYTALTKTTNANGDTVYEYTLQNGESGTATTDQVTWDNRWRVYFAPPAGTAGASAHFTQTESDNSIMNVYFNNTTDATGNPVAGNLTYLYFNDDGSYNAAANGETTMYSVYSNGNGANPTQTTVAFNDTTQYSGSTTAFGSSNGNAYGVLQSIQIDNSGIITGSYTNGVLRNEAQIAIAQFVNSAGLTKVGSSLYQASNNSGTANVKTVDALGLEITPSSLEMSNVELASELADMIITQRGFQSNSKIMTVADEMLETIINMKR